MSQRPADLRLFVAIYPPRETAAILLAALEGLGLDSRGVVSIEQVHLTLQFIGQTPARELDEVQESVVRAAAGLPGFELRPQRLITLPEGSRPRLIAAETDAPAPLAELHRRLAHRLARNVRDRAHERFRPHLTLQRFQSPARPQNLPVDVAPFRVTYMSLMRSLLKPQGAEHAEVSRVELG